MNNDFIRNVFHGMIGAGAAAYLAWGAVLPASHAATVTVFSTDFVSGGSNQTLDGTNTGLTTNQPGSSWIWGAGWNWTGPQVYATWMGGTNQNIATLGEEKTALGLALSSTGAYTKPTSIHIAGDLNVTTNTQRLTGGGLGFWSAMADRNDTLTSVTHFTGLLVNGGGDVVLYEDGVVKTTVSTSALAVNTYYNLSYDIDTTTGGISNVSFNGSTLSGFSSTAFTDAATAYVGVMSNNSGRTEFDNFVVSSVPEPALLTLLGLGGLALLRRRTNRSE